MRYTDSLIDAFFPCRDLRLLGLDLVRISSVGHLVLSIGDGRVVQNVADGNYRCTLGHTMSQIKLFIVFRTTNYII
jgi:hypothetical protein